MPLSVHDFGGGTVTLLDKWGGSDLRPMNPTIIRRWGKVLMFVRLIEGNVDDNERYTLYKNYESWVGVVELSPYTFLPVSGTESFVKMLDEDGSSMQKIEDVRAFIRDGEFILSGSILDHNVERTWFDNTQIEFRYDHDLREARFIRRLPKRWKGSREKNWTAPAAPAEFEYIVDPSRVFVHGEIEHFPEIDSKHEKLHGGTQAIPINIGGERHWLTIMHQQLLLNDDFQSWKYHSADDSGRLYCYYTMLYLHYAVIFDKSGKLFNIGRPFIFDRPSTEFAAGILREGSTLLVSYGSMDREAKLAHLPMWAFLDYSFPYTGLDWRTD